MMLGCILKIVEFPVPLLLQRLANYIHHQKAFRLSPKVWYIVWGWLLQVDQWDRWFDWESNLRNEGATGFLDQVQHPVRRTLWCSCCGWLQADGAAVPLLSKPCGALKWKDDRPGKSCCEWWHNWSLFPAPAARPQGYEIQLRGALQLSPKVVLRRWTQLYVMVMSSGCEG